MSEKVGTLLTPDSSDWRLPTLPLDLGWSFRKSEARAPWLSALLSAGPLRRFGGRRKDRHRENIDERVDLPHCWNESDTFSYGIDYFRGLGHYRRLVEIPTEDSLPEGRWVLEAEGFYGLAEIQVNGHRVSKVDGQYLGFEIDLQDVLEAGAENELELQLSNRCPSWVLPGYTREDPDFILHGGLAGHLRLRRRPLMRFDRRQLRVSPQDLFAADPRIDLDFCVRNGAPAARGITVVWRLFDDVGAEVAHVEQEAERVAPGASWNESLSLPVDSPRLWSDQEPRLYRLEGRVLSAGQTVDRVERRVGLRHAEFRRNDGFFLNGERCEIRGVNRHENMPGFGSALPDSWHRRDAELIKSLGLNFVRLSHYPQHSRFLDACDELGLLVMPEVASWKSVRAGRWLRSARRQMTEMILRDRHRASIVLWGLGNESRDRRAYTELRQIVQELDPSRPVTYAENHLYRARRQKTVGIPDVWGINYELDVLEQAREASRLENVLITECMNHPRSVRGDLQEEETQLEVIERDHRLLEGKGFVSGFVVWALSDYATMHRQRFRRLPGLVDAWRQPKMVASWIAARYADRPILELCGQWGDRDETTAHERRIHIFSNCQSVKVLLGDREIADLDGGPHHLITVDAEPGVALEALGSFRHQETGQQEITASLPWHGPAHGLRVRLSESHIDPALRETVDIDVRVVDPQGLLVTHWNGEVRVKVTGPIRARCFSEQGTLLVSRGTGRGFLTATGGNGEATVKVAATDLEPASAALTCRGSESG